MSTTTRIPPADVDAGFQKRLGLFDATMLVAGAMIGSGIFIVSSTIARDVGSSGWLLGVWVLTGLITLMGALSYAELAAMMPHAGGQYVYLREAYSPLWGFLYGWTVFLVVQTGLIAAVSVAFAKFLGVLVPRLGTGPDGLLYEYTFTPARALYLPLPWLQEPLRVFHRESFTVHAGQLVAVGLIVVLTAINCRGVQEGKLVQNVFTVAKTLALMLLIIVGLTVARSSEAIATNSADPWGGIYSTGPFQQVRRLVSGPDLLVALMVAGGAMVGALFSADAWYNVTYTAGEVRNPQRVLPLSLILGAGGVILLYILANVAYLAALPIQGDPVGSTPFERGIAYATDKRVGTAVLELVSPRLGVTLMALAIMVSTAGCVNGLVLMGPRLYYAMARDGLFFQSVGALSSRAVPAVGLVLQAVWSVVLVFTGTYDDLLDYITFAAVLFYAVTVGGLFVLRWKRPDAERPYKALGYPVLPALYVLLCVFILLDLLMVRPVFTWPGLILVLTGIPVYFLWRWRNPAPAGPQAR